MALTTKSGKPITIGFGTGTQWKDLKRSTNGKFCEELVDQIRFALNSGYNHIDSAQAYNTFKEIALAISQEKVDRANIFITSKYSPSSQQSVAEFIDDSLTQLNSSYVDLLLIHSATNDIESIWSQFIIARNSGKVRFIGVSNFAVKHIERLFALSKEYPKANQIEWHALLQNQTANIELFAKQHDILIETYGIMTPLSFDVPINSLLQSLATKYTKTPGQILLKFTLQSGHLPITTSKNQTRISQGLQIGDFSLDDSDFNLIRSEGESFFEANYENPQFDELYARTKKIRNNP